MNTESKFMRIIICFYTFEICNTEKKYWNSFLMRTMMVGIGLPIDFTIQIYCIVIIIRLYFITLKSKSTTINNIPTSAIPNKYSAIRSVNLFLFSFIVCIE